MIKNHKIIVTGPVGAGKTTAIATLSDIAVISTDETATDMTREYKKGTTVALDYGVMNLDDGERIHLYGTPGQERFNFMWDILVEGGIGLVLLLDNTRSDPLLDLSFFLSSFTGFINQTHVAIGITKMDKTRKLTIHDYQQQLLTYPKQIPVFEVDARDRRDISILVEALLCSLDPGLVA